MTKVGEHITLDIVGTTKEYSPEFYEKLVCLQILKLDNSCWSAKKMSYFVYSICS